MRIKWNIQGFEEIRRSDEVVSLVGEVADDILSQLPRGFTSSGRQGKSRYREIIFADTSSAYRAQLRTNALQKVLFEMGG